ncbi:Arrestin domain-containing protein 1 [Eumeta japonica]|uniref:Arrestin domain-containing protein 1 n=1 Tax=Eumeta variegata TaxID=151549 RepID=A0A4C1UVP9_EUMVA|nr:Arrestin domain-containing protein 1 [Eumeta japonica]
MWRRENRLANLISLEGIYIKIDGFAHVHWTTRRSRRVNGRSEYYTVNHDGHEDYLSVKQYLVGGEHALSICKFHEEFDIQNLELFHPKKDQCEICALYKVGNTSQEDYTEHLKKKEEARSEKEKYIREESLVFTVDLQAVHIPFRRCHYAKALRKRTELRFGFASLSCISVCYRREHHLEAGDYSFDFQCPIPAHCPSSFEHEYGHIRYEIKVVVDRIFKLDKVKKMSIKVISPLDLNQDPYCKEPLVFSFEETYCCCCISSGFSEVLVKLPVAGYCPGQIIPVELHCSNNSSVEIEDIKLSLIKKMRFTANHHPDTKYDVDKIIETVKGPVSGFTTRNWNIDIHIPSIDIYNVDNCRLIDIEYEFKVKIGPSGCHSDTTDAKRIVLGTIPLADYRNNVPYQAQMPQVQTKNFINANLPHPAPNPPYPLTGSPYPSADPVNLSANPPYPSVPYPTFDAKVNLPYPAVNPPYPVTNSPYPNPNPGIGFRIQGTETSGNLSPIPVPSVILAPSAPEPSTPDDDSKY